LRSTTALRPQAQQAGKELRVGIGRVDLALEPQDLLQRLREPVVGPVRKAGEPELVAGDQQDVGAVRHGCSSDPYFYIKGEVTVNPP
jgi:hypothetical protein